MTTTLVNLDTKPLLRLGFVRIGTQAPERTIGADRFAGKADIPPEMNQLQSERVPGPFRDDRHQIVFDFNGVGVIGQPEAPADALDMGVDDHARDAEGGPQYHIGGFAADTWQSGEGVQTARHPTVMLIGQGLGAGLDVAGFIVEKTGGSNEGFNLAQGAAAKVVALGNFSNRAPVTLLT